MTIKINSIGSYIPENYVSNYDLQEKFEIDENFITEKIGIEQTAKKSEGELTSDMCVKAINDLAKLNESFDVNEIEILVLVTQNPDRRIPHTSSIIHNKLNLSEHCLCFDVSQGCAGYIYGLSIITSFMDQNNLKNGLLLTCDPYSEIINPDDKNTVLLFGDGASATFLNETGKWKMLGYDFITDPNSCKDLFEINNSLNMNGRKIFNFASKVVPKSINRILEKFELEKTDVDFFLFHQGSKIIVGFLRKMLKLEEDKAPFLISKYGNTVSSSIPIMLKNYLDQDIKYVIAAGFGVGLTAGTAILEKENE